MVIVRLPKNTWKIANGNCAQEEDDDDGDQRDQIG